LPINHKYRKDFFIDKVERDVTPSVPLGEELYDVVSQYEGIVFGIQFGKQKFHGFGVTINWIKQICFLELSHWNNNLLLYNLDVMYIEMNMFENIFNMVMDVKEKTKDNMIARIDIYLLCHCKNIELVYDESRVAKPKVSFALNKNAQLLVYQCLKSLCFPNGYASNISRLVNMKDDKLFGMKSYDYHVFIQTFIPLAYQDLLSKGI
jgi:hypothetical protein